MKKIINKKVYDTEIATLVGEYQYANWGDFKYLSEDLYITKKNNWFLHYVGGAGSKYGRSCGSSTICGSEGIEPMTKQEALEWLEEYGEAEQIEKYFLEELEEA